MSWVGYWKGAGLITDYPYAVYEGYKTYKQYKRFTKRYPDSWKFRANRRRSWNNNRYRLRNSWEHKYKNIRPSNIGTLR